MVRIRKIFRKINLGNCFIPDPPLDFQFQLSKTTFTSFPSPHRKKLAPGMGGSGIARLCWGLLGQTIAPYFAASVYKAIHGPGTVRTNPARVGPANAGQCFVAEFFGTFFLFLSILASNGNLVGGFFFVFDLFLFYYFYLGGVLGICA